MTEYPIYAGGKFLKTADKLSVSNPYTNQAFAYTYLADKLIIDNSIQKALSVQNRLKAMPSYQRFEILQRILEGIKLQREEFARLIALEAGKPMRYALGETDRAIQTFLIAAEESKRLPKEYITLDWTSAGTGRDGIVKYFPVGLVAAISPFNFPLNLAVHKIAPAIAAGNPVVLKPARKTPLSTLKLAQIIDSTSLPKGAVSVIPADRKNGDMLITDSRFRMLSFTGSPAVGWKMKARAGKKKVILELGGNAGTIVTESCDLEHAVKRCLLGGFAYSGQVCIHAQRFFVHQSVFMQFTENLRDSVNQLKKGDPLSLETDISVMIDSDNARRVQEWINEAVANGAKIITGGNSNDAFVEPTILTNTNNRMKVCNREIFGPVITVESYSTFDEAIKQINDTEFGLQAGVFTNKLTEMNQAFEQRETGGVIINDGPTFRVDNMPYGGIKNSGFGREGVAYTIKEMMEAKILVKPQ